MVSSGTRKELEEIARKDKWDLIDDLMLKDLIVTSDGFYLEREEGDVGYNRFLGKPNLSETVMQRMANEINQLSRLAKAEVLTTLKTRFPAIYDRLPLSDRDACEDCLHYCEGCRCQTMRGCSICKCKPYEEEDDDE